jgi:hypothetical protein
VGKKTPTFLFIFIYSRKYKNKEITGARAVLRELPKLKKEKTSSLRDTL